MAIVLPAMAQSSNNMVGNSQTGQAQVRSRLTTASIGGVGIGAGTVAGNILYVRRGGLRNSGGITGGASYLVTGGNTQPPIRFGAVHSAAIYVLTPDMVSGDKPIHFSGPTVTPPAASSGAPTAMNSTQSIQSTRTASAEVGGPVSSAPIAGSATTGSTMAQPADHGTGPVMPSSPTAPAPNGGVVVPPLPSSIE